MLSVIDIGSGGGVPAIPLAIVMPDVRFTMVEATGKKAEFLDRTIGELGLANARVLQERAEQIGQNHKEHREKYDAAMARALGHLAIVVELCGPLVRPHGIVVAVKGAKAEQELEESAKAMGMVGLRHVETVTTPTGRLVLMEKTTRTPRLYPRRDGEPSRVPLGIARDRK
jgi:16S rRNA (guanine527-N7)-methyltransferase